MEKSTGIALKSKTRDTIWSSNHTPGHVPSKPKPLTWKYICTCVFQCSVFLLLWFRSLVVTLKKHYHVNLIHKLELCFLKSSLPSSLVLTHPATAVGMLTLHAKLLQSCLTLCNPMDCSPPGSSVHGILQARILEQIATASSRGIFPAER